MCGSLSRNIKAVFSLVIFAAFLAVVQLLGGGSLNRLTSRPRMLADHYLHHLADDDAPSGFDGSLGQADQDSFMNTPSCLRRPCASLYRISSPKARPFRKPRPAGPRREGQYFKKLVNYMSVVQPLMLKSWAGRKRWPSPELRDSAVTNTVL